MHGVMDAKHPKQMITFTLDPNLIRRMKAWIAKQDMPPPQNAVMAMALKEFLDKREGQYGQREGLSKT